jgi:hypothetical protein
LADIQKNLKKYDSNQLSDLDNVDEFLNKVKSSNGAEGFFSVSFEHNHAQNPKNNLVEVEDTFELGTHNQEINFIKFYNDLPSSPHKNSNCSTLRFGIGPLEAIEESHGEEIGTSNKTINLYTNKSYQCSPRTILLAQPVIKKNFRSSVHAIESSKPSPRKKSSVAVISPYAQHLYFSPQRLPSINNGDKKIRFLKTHKKNKKK